MAESMSNFRRRVRKLTGMDLDEIPRGEREDALLHKLAVRGPIFVVGYDRYPERDEDGLIFTEFRVVDLSE